jgi:hypothetical protein
MNGEEMGGSKEEFLRYLRAGDNFFKAFCDLRDELDRYMNAWGDIEHDVGLGLMCSFTGRFNHLTSAVQRVTRGLGEINDQIEELKLPRH